MQTSPGTSNASATSENRRGEDVTFTQDGGEKGYVGVKTGSERLVDQVERSL